MKKCIPLRITAALTAAVLYIGERKTESSHDSSLVIRWTAMPVVLTIVTIAVAAFLIHRSDGNEAPRSAIAALQRYGCVGCHTIHGVPSGAGLVGPPLAGLAARTYIGGSIRNDAGALADWIVDPTRYNPNSAMPRTGISKAEANEVANYLYQH
jgi:mono/diheme cytochrome c family protein